MRKTLLITSAVIMLTAATVFAQMGNDHGGMMGDGWGWGMGYGWGFGIFIVILVVFVVAYMMKRK